MGVAVDVDWNTGRDVEECVDEDVGRRRAAAILRGAGWRKGVNDALSLSDAPVELCCVVWGSPP